MTHFGESEWSIELTSDQHLMEEYRDTLIIDGNQSTATAPEND